MRVLELGGSKAKGFDGSCGGGRVEANLAGWGSLGGIGNEVSVLMSEVSRARGAGRVLMPLSISTAATFFSASPDIRGEGDQVVRLFFFFSLSFYPSAVLLVFVVAIGLGFWRCWFRCWFRCWCGEIAHGTMRLAKMPLDPNVSAQSRPAVTAESPRPPEDRPEINRQILAA